MKRLFNYIYLFFILGISFPCVSQATHFTTTVEQINASLLSYTTNETLTIIDVELLKDKQSEKNLVVLKGLKVEALVQAELYNDALELSNSIINSPFLTGDYRIRVLLQRALLYEILDKFSQSKKELDIVNAIYKNPSVKRNQHYGEYLYRVSSLYRMQKQERSALYYAFKSKKFGDSHNYKNVSAVASMLISFMSKDTATRFFYLNQSLSVWKEYGDNHGLCAIYTACAQISKKEKNYEMCLKYSDSAIFHGKRTANYNTHSKAYLLKGEYFEHFKKMDSALYYYKQYEALQKKQVNFQEKLKVNQMEFNFKLQEEQIKKDKVFEDNVQIKAHNRNLIIFIIGLSVFLTVILVLMNNIFHNNKKIKLQKKDIESVNLELSDSVKEKELLFKELHHRVKNNLALIMGLVEFHANEIEDPVYIDKFNALRNRINSIAIVHREFLTSDVTNINQEQNIAEYTNKIVNALISLHSEKIYYNAAIQNINLPINQAVPIGMLLNELISNTIKHAKVEQFIEINLEIALTDNVLIINYSDNGSSFQPKKDHSSLGVFIIESMISQLNGHFTRKQSHYKISLNLYDKHSTKKQHTHRRR